MSEKENRLNELKKETKLLDIIGIAGTIIAIIGVVFIIIGSFVKENVVIDRLFWISIGACIADVIVLVTATIAEHKKIDEITKLKKEIKNSK